MEELERCMGHHWRINASLRVFPKALCVHTHTHTYTVTKAVCSPYAKDFSINRNILRVILSNTHFFPYLNFFRSPACSLPGDISMPSFTRAIRLSNLKHTENKLCDVGVQQWMMQGQPHGKNQRSRRRNDKEAALHPWLHKNVIRRLLWNTGT